MVATTATGLLTLVSVPLEITPAPSWRCLVPAQFIFPAKLEPATEKEYKLALFPLFIPTPHAIG